MIRKLLAGATLFASALVVTLSPSVAFAQPAITRPEALPAQVPNTRAVSTLTIASGSITANRQRHLVDTESSAASDDLTTVVPWSGILAGQTLEISTADAGRDVVIKDGSGSNLIATPNDADVTLDDLEDVAVLRWTGSQWRLINVGGGGSANLGLTFFAIDQMSGANDAAKMQAAFDAAGPVRGVVWATPGKTYSTGFTGCTTSCVTLSSSHNGVTFEGNGAKIVTSGTGNYSALRLAGADSGGNTTIAGASAEGALTISATSSTNFAVGDLIRVGTLYTVSGGAENGTVYSHIGHFKITAISGSGPYTFTLDRPLPFPTTTTTNGSYSGYPYIKEVVPIKDVRISNLTIDKSGQTDQTIFQGALIYLGAENLTLDNVNFIGNDNGFALQSFHGGYNNKMRFATSTKGGGGVDNNADIQWHGDSLLFVDTITSEQSGGFGVTCNYCYDFHFSNVTVNNTSARGLKFEGARYGGGSGLHVGDAGSTGIMFARASGKLSFNDVKAINNGTDLGSGHRYGLYFDAGGTDDINLTGVVTSGNVDYDVYAQAPGSGNRINGRIGNPLKVFNENGTAVSIDAIGVGRLGNSPGATIDPIVFCSRQQSLNGVADAAANDELCAYYFYGLNSSGTAYPYAYFYPRSTTVTAGSEAADFQFRVANGAGGWAPIALTPTGVTVNGNAIGAPQKEINIVRGTDQTGLTDGSWNKIQLNSETLDADGTFDSATNYRWTPGIAGHATICVAAFIQDNITAGQQFAVAIYKNGSSMSQFVQIAEAQADSANMIWVSGCSNDAHDNDDYYEAWMLDGTGGTQRVTASSTTTYMRAYTLQN